MDVDSLTPESAKDRRVGWAVVGAIWIVASVAIYLLAKSNITPRRFIDEFLYWNLAKNFSHGDGLSWNGTVVALRSWLYPVAIAPVFRLANSVAGQYAGVQALNSAMLCSVVFPAYWMARRFAGRGLGILAAVLAIAVPAMNYAGIVGTESLAYLTCTLAFAAMLGVLARPSLRTTAFALLLIAVAALTRTQLLILVPILAVSVFAVAALRGSEGWRAYLASQRALLVALGVCVAVATAYLLVAGRGGLGIYVGVFNGAHVTIGNLVFWVRGFASDVYLLAAILPTIATFALLGSQSNRRDPWAGSLVVLALVASVFFVLQMSWFSAINTFHWRELHIFYERYMFYLGPLFFTGLVASFGRISLRAAAVSTLVAAVVVALTPPDVIAVPFSIDAFGQAYLGFLIDQNDSLLGHIGLLLGVLTLLLGGLLMLSTLGEDREELKKWGRNLALGAPLFLLLITQAKAWSYSGIYSESVFAQQPKPLDFVDRASRGRAGILVARGSDPSTFYATSFWNPGIDRYFVSSETPVDSPVVYAPNCRFAWRADGRIYSPPAGAGDCPDLPATWLVQSNLFTMHLRDESVRVRGRGGVSSTVMAAPSPARILSMASGRTTKNGTLSGPYALRTFLDRPGELRLVLQAPTGGVSVDVPGGRRVLLAGTRRTTVTIPIPARDHLTRLAVVPTASGTVKAVKVKQAQVREGGGPWLDVD